MELRSVLRLLRICNLLNALVIVVLYPLGLVVQFSFNLQKFLLMVYAM